MASAKRHQIGFRDVANGLSEIWERIGVAVRHPHAAADESVVADELAFLGDREEPEILGVDIDAVVVGRCEANLELARQISRAVNGLDIGHTGILLLAIEPNFVIGPATRRQVSRQRFCRLLQFAAHRTVKRGWTRHDISRYVAAGHQGGQQALVDAGNGGFQVVFQHSMKLYALAGREAQGAIGIFAGEIVDGQILSGSEAAAGELAADHEHMVLADAGFRSVLAGVAVFLLIGAVELEKLLVGLGEVIDGLYQLECDRPAATVDFAP